MSETHVTHTPGPSGPEPTLGALVNQLTTQIPELVRSEIRLAQAEVTEKGKRAGIGIGLIPDYLTGEDGDLVPVLQEASLPTISVYFVYPEELKTAKKVQVFRDFLVTKARQWKF